MMRKHQVLALRKKGLRQSDIARRLGVTDAYVSLTLKRAKCDSLSSKTGVFVECEKLRSRLVPHAVARGISIDELARRVLSIVCEEKLINSVLDDEDEKVIAQNEASAELEFCDVC